MSLRRSLWLAGVATLLALTIGLGTTMATSVKKPVDWAAINPAFEGATFVNDRAKCLSCHEDDMKGFDATVHAKAFNHNMPSPGGECESCHGPRSKHVEEPANVFASAPMTAAQESAVCQQCHAGGPRMSWHAGEHQANDVSCTSCHSVMENKSERFLLDKATQSDTCYTCHADVRLQMNKMSHHPVREGRMECASCHNVHGATRDLLLKNTQNETCYTCHAEKRGPFVWEHAPAREDCSTCHVAHGSSNRSLLETKDPFLCLSCHSYGGHINLPRYNRVSNPYGNGCSNCHIAMHGSNHPSGAKLTR